MIAPSNIGASEDLCQGPKVRYRCRRLYLVGGPVAMGCWQWGPGAGPHELGRRRASTAIRTSSKISKGIADSTQSILGRCEYTRVVLGLGPSSVSKEIRLHPHWWVLPDASCSNLRFGGPLIASSVRIAGGCSSRAVMGCPRARADLRMWRGGRKGP